MAGDDRTGDRSSGRTGDRTGGGPAAVRPEVLRLDDPAIVGEVREGPPPDRTAALPAAPPGGVRRWARRLVLGGAAGLVLTVLADQAVHWGVTWFTEETALSWL